MKLQSKNKSKCPTYTRLFIMQTSHDTKNCQYWAYRK